MYKSTRRNEKTRRKLRYVLPAFDLLSLQKYQKLEFRQREYGLIDNLKLQSVFKNCDHMYSNPLHHWHKVIGALWDALVKNRANVFSQLGPIDCCCFKSTHSTFLALSLFVLSDTTSLKWNNAWETSPRRGNELFQGLTELWFMAGKAKLHRKKEEEIMTPLIRFISLCWSAGHQVCLSSSCIQVLVIYYKYLGLFFLLLWGSGLVSCKS